MDTQIIESLGWLFLMLYFPLLRISDKKLENIHINMYIYVIFIIMPIIIIFYCFLNANYPLLLSIFLAFFYFVIMFLVPEDSSLKKYISLDEPGEFFILLIITFAFLLVGLYSKTYIFVISGYIYLVLTFFQYISDVYLDAESPPNYPKNSPRGRLKFKPGLHLYISSISILFILESFGISDVFGVIDTESIHRLYSTIAQVFSALFGIIMLIGVFILDKNLDKKVEVTCVNNVKQAIKKEWGSDDPIKKEEKSFKNKLLNALKGFTLLYIIVIFISIMGIAIHHETDIDLKLDTIIPDGSFEERQLPDSNQILYSGLFTIILTLFFSSFIYLYDLIQIVFKWGIEIET